MNKKSLIYNIFPPFLMILSLMSSTLYGKDALPLPRYAALNSDKVNLRVGPGNEYPIAWVYKVAHLPVKIIAEYDTWRQIEDADKTTGWVHQNMLTGKRHVQVRQKADLLASAGRDAKVRAHVQPGVIFKLKKCQTEFCRVIAGNADGWIHKDTLWGVEEKDFVS